MARGRPRSEKSVDQVQRGRAKDALAAWMAEPRSIEDIRQFLEQHFARPVVRRTAERYRDWMIDGFGALAAKTSTGRKGWMVPAKVPGPSMLTSQQLARCRRAADWLEREGRATWAQTLREISGLFAAEQAETPRRVTEVAVLSPAIRVRIAPWVESALQRAMARNRALRVRYRMTKVGDRVKKSGRILETTIHPYGIVYGERPFLVGGYDVGNRLARDERGERRIGWYALDRFERISESGSPIVGRGDFDLTAYVQRWFGTPRGDEDPFDVAWRFRPEVAERAALYEFHPTQRLQREDDGSLMVRFRAAGSLEMYWQLLRWGDTVEILSPDPTRFNAAVEEQQERWRAYFA